MARVAPIWPERTPLHRHVHSPRDECGFLTDTVHFSKQGVDFFGGGQLVFTCHSGWNEVQAARPRNGPQRKWRVSDGNLAEFRESGLQAGLTIVTKSRCSRISRRTMWYQWWNVCGGSDAPPPAVESYAYGAEKRPSSRVANRCDERSLPIATCASTIPAPVERAAIEPLPSIGRD